VVLGDPRHNKERPFRGPQRTKTLMASPMTCRS